MNPTRFPVTANQFVVAVLTMVPATCALASGGTGYPSAVGPDWQLIAQAVGTLLLIVLTYFAKKIYEDTQQSKQQMVLMAQSHEGLAKGHTDLVASINELKAAVKEIASEHAELEKEVSRVRRERRHRTRRKT